MATQRLVNDLADGTQEIQIGSADSIATPVFGPEIKGAEDLIAILNHLDVLEPNNPIFVPGHRWRKLRDQETTGGQQEKLAKLLTDHPILMYEPPELFRFSLGGSLVTYALKGSRPRKSDFNSELKNLNVDAALSILPAFFQEFARAQLSKLYTSAKLGEKNAPDSPSEIAVPTQIQEAELNLSVAEVWQYRVTDSMLSDYFITLIRDALSFDNADIAIIPPVPPLRRSDDDIVENVFDVNETMLYLCDRFSSIETNSVFPYLHLYVDQGIFAEDSDVRYEILQQLREEIQSEYTGLSLTVSGYEQIWDNEWDGKFESFVTELNNICKENYIPIVCPRSEYYGAYLSDLNVNIFGSLLRKKQQYYDQIGGPGVVQMYSSIPDIENGSFMNILELDRHLVENGELAEISGLKGRPDNYPPYEKEPLEDIIADGDEYEAIKSRFQTPSAHRKYMGKPRWLTFVEFARRLRDGRREGLLSPAKTYLKDTEHDHLS